MNKYDSKIDLMWSNTFKYKHAMVEFDNGSTEDFSPSQMKYLLTSYEQWLIDGNEAILEGTNSNLIASIDDRFSRFLAAVGIDSINFMNEEDVQCRQIR